MWKEREIVFLFYLLTKLPVIQAQKKSTLHRISDVYKRVTTVLELFNFTDLIGFASLWTY